MFLRATGGSLQMPVMSSGTEIAFYRTYAEVRAAANFPSGEELDIRSTTVAGTDLYLVEGVAGRLTMAKAALSGASSGALWGTSIGLMMSFVSTNQPAFPWALLGIVGGALAGTFMSELLYAMTDERRDLTSQSQIVASRYAIPTSAGIDQTFELSRHSPGNQMYLHPARCWPESEGPSEYDSRSDEKPRFGIWLSDEGEDGGAEAPRNNEHATSAQEPAEIAVEPAEDPRRPLD